MRIAGVDGCKSGWVVAWEGTPVEVEVFRSFEAVINRNPNRNADRSPDLKPKLLVVDIPIGLAERGAREADRLARACLKGRACCVFNAPLRGMLQCADYDAACDYGEQVEGKRISRQTWGIIPKIREVDAALAATGHASVKEGHPEVSFALMNGNKPLTDRKNSSEGRAARLGLLEQHFPGISREVEKHGALRGDVIDALAMLWTARRIENGEAQALPETPLKDARGLAMQI